MYHLFVCMFDITSTNPFYRSSDKTHSEFCMYYDKNFIQNDNTDRNKTLYKINIE